jgi:hypothetical protein
MEQEDCESRVYKRSNNGNSGRSPCPRTPRNRQSSVDEPFHQYLQCTIEAGALCSPGAACAVPAGRRLVIERVSFRADVPAGSGHTLTAHVDSVLNGSCNVHCIAGTHLGRNGFYPDRDVFVGESIERIDADAGSIVYVSLARTGDAARQSVAFLTLSGYLIDAP